MKCMILAAGYATRLYPLTENFPKPLLTVGDKTILDWLIDDIQTSGEVDEYIVISNHKYAEHFRQWAADRTVPVTVVDDGTDTNETRLGAVRDIQFAIETVRPEDGLLVIAGDNVLDFSLTGFIAWAKKKAAPCVMRYFEPDEKRLKKCGVIEVGAEDRILSMAEKPAEPKSNWCCPPFYYYPRAVLPRVKEAIDGGECGTDAPGSFIAWLSRSEPVYAMEMPGSRYDIGNLESYEKVRAEYRGITK